MPKLSNTSFLHIIVPTLPHTASQIFKRKNLLRSQQAEKFQRAGQVARNISRRALGELINFWYNFCMDPNPQIQTVQPRSNKFIYLVLFLILIIVIGIGYVYGKKLLIPQVSTTQSVDQLPTKTAGKLLILIEASLTNGLQSELETYRRDVKNELGWDTEIKEVTSTDDIFLLKDFVKNVYKTKGLGGVLLVGNVPTGMMYHPEVDTSSLFNSEGYILGDSIYQDLNDDCVYSAQKQAFSYKNVECQVVTTIQPYWVARLTPNSTKISSLVLLKDYFKRNHDFRTGIVTFGKKQLAYMPLLNESPTRKKEEQNFKDYFVVYGEYSPSDLTFIDQTRTDSDQLYLSAIAQPYKYEAVTFNGHGAPNFHQKNIGPKDITKTSFVYINLLSCSVGRFTTPDYLAGEYLFGGGLITIANSVPVFSTSLFDKDLYEMLTNGIPFYKAFEFGGIGANILGDPTLKMRYGPVDKSTAKMNLSLNELSFSKSTKEQKLVIQNTGTSPLIFTARFKLLKQKNSSYYKGSGYGMDSNVISDNTGQNMILPGKSSTFAFQREYFIKEDGLPPGRYEGRFLIVSNDSEQPLVEIPVYYQKD